MSFDVKKVWLSAAILAAAVSAAWAQVGSGQDFQCFPSCSEVDSRMLSLGGTALNTVAGFQIEIQITVPPDASQFEIGIFDGDTGKDDAGNMTSGNPVFGTWDEGTDELLYNLIADPFGDGTGMVLVAQWFGNSDNAPPAAAAPPAANWKASHVRMPNNGWWNVLVDTQEIARTGPGAPHLYRLQIVNPFPAVTVSSSFKVRTTASMVVRSPGAAWGVQSAVRRAGGPTARIVYPQWDGLFTLPTPDFFLNTTSTYDGTFEFLFHVPPGQSEIRIFDGDFDFGSARTSTGFLSGVPSRAALEPCQDADDPNSGGVPVFAPLAVAEGAVSTSGNPPDDSQFDIFRRTPCVRIDVIDPDGTVYRNDNPSGNLEWEQFVITALPADETEADYSPTFAADGATFVAPGVLRSGLWRIVLRGLDVGNTVFLNGPDVSGVPSASLGDRVWIDRNGDGVQGDPALEPGVNGVLVQLYLDDGDGRFDPNPNPGAAFGFDTLVAQQKTSGDGQYLFRGLGGGKYWVHVDSSSFVAGETLFGAERTFDLNGALDDAGLVALAESQQFVDADFGYRFGLIGDLVWQDDNRDGLYQPLSGEIGIPNVTVRLTGDFDGDGTLDAMTAQTDNEGFYLFADNPANPQCSGCGFPMGEYTVETLGQNFNSGMPLSGAAQTYDFDGHLDNFTGLNVPLTGGIDFLDADFGYVRPCAACEGQATELTLRYLGTAANALIRVDQKKDGTAFEGVVQPGEIFSFVGTGKKGTLGTEIEIYVNGALNTKIHTSCSLPLGPGLVVGDFVVAEGFSRNGGLLCSVP